MSGYRSPIAITDGSILGEARMNLPITLTGIVEGRWPPRPAGPDAAGGLPPDALIILLLLIMPVVTILIWLLRKMLVHPAPPWPDARRPSACSKQSPTR